MHLIVVLSAVAAFMPSTSAAPQARVSQFQGQSQVGSTDESGGHEKWGTLPFVYNGTNSTTSHVPAASSTVLDIYPSGHHSETHNMDLASAYCPDEVVISTTTLEVTMFITEKGFDDPYPTSTDGTTLPASQVLTGKHNQTTSTSTMNYGIQPTLVTENEPVYYPEPQVTEISTSRWGTYTRRNSTMLSTPTVTNHTYGLLTSAQFEHSVTASSDTRSAFAETSIVVSHTNGTTSMAAIPKSTNSCVIDTKIVPLTTATSALAPGAMERATITISEADAPTGTPQGQTRHCGVHGLPVETYFLARFVENEAGVPVTLEGCYQFCNSAMKATEGCKSYRFYPELAINAPRCDLYSSDVALALDKIDDRHSDFWFDLECGSPMSERWKGLQGMARLMELGLD